MISKMAKQDYEMMLKDGLNPSFEDIIRLNALALKVENGTEAYDFSALPRVAFLGDYILEEPSVYKRFWMDKAIQQMTDGYYTKLYFYAYALNTPDDELPKIGDVRKLTKAIDKFIEDIIHNTETQILTAIDYVMNGNEPNANEDYETRKEFEQVYEIPTSLKSVSQQLIAEAYSQGLTEDCIHFTHPVLERMICVAMMKNGTDVLKNEHAKAAGKYYAFITDLKKRLTKGKEDGEK